MKKLALFLIYIALLLLSTKQTFASVIFEDDFNEYTDNSFPSKWVPYNQFPACNAQWIVQGGVLKISIIPSGCNAHIVPSSTSWSHVLNEYIFESDIRFISGIDRHFSYRINPETGLIKVIHFAIPGDFAIDTDNPNYLVYVGGTYNYNHTYHFKMVVTSNRLKVYVGEPNGELNLVRDVMHLSPIPAGMIGLGSNPGGSSVTETWFDNVKVTTLNDDLNVPLLKQTDPQWGSNIYDSANLWSSDSLTQGTSIGRWGCAVTSAAMVLQYYNVTKLPNGYDLNPGTLNSYLQSIPDGYIRNGLTNWQAIAALTRKAKPYNSNFLYDALQYKYSGNNDTTLLTNDIHNNMPDILQEDMGGGNTHFVVAKGVGDSTFNINDPAFNRTDLSQYNNSFSSIRRFVPSYTDLSYLMFVVDPNVDISVTDSKGNSVGDIVIENSIVDPINFLTNAVGPLKVVYISEPPTDDYNVKISSASPEKYTLNTYIYDVNGEVKVNTDTGYVDNGYEDNYNVFEYQPDVSASKITQTKPTFDSLLGDITVLYKLGKITKKGSYNYLINKISQAQSYSITDPARAADILNIVKSQLVDDKKKGIDAEASGFIIGQIDFLLTIL